MIDATRTEDADRFREEYLKGNNGYKVEQAGVRSFTLIDDGQCRWVAESDEYETSVETIADRILRGEYDRANAEDLPGIMYSELCEVCDYLYCNQSAHDETELRELLVHENDFDRDYICDFLGI